MYASILVRERYLFNVLTLTGGVSIMRHSGISRYSTPLYYMQSIHAVCMLYRR